MFDIIQREAIYLWYYFSVQLQQIAPYWLLGIVIGSMVSVFGKDKIHNILVSIQQKHLGIAGLVPASLLGIASPLCMYGTIPIAASFSQKGVKDDYLAAFMMSSVLLNPQLLIYSSALGSFALSVRFICCFLCGIIAGLLVRIFYKKKSFFRFTKFYEISNRDTDPNIFLRLLKNIFRNMKATGYWFLIGIVLSALFQRYVPTQQFASLFGKQEYFGLLMAATIGVPLYVCGGGTIPLLQQWLTEGMSMGAAASFMITGASTKITNLSALKIVIGTKNFVLYFIYIIVFSLLCGLFVNMI
ncbi:MAG: permease [Firmicutes bacterium]|nr:permease [Bacillota bacterium]